jgi:hypothetical protein
LVRIIDALTDAVVHGIGSPPFGFAVSVLLVAILARLYEEISGEQLHEWVKLGIGIAEVVSLLTAIVVSAVVAFRDLLGKDGGDHKK